MRTELPWPSSLLTGHAKGHWRIKAKVTKAHRMWAYVAALAAEKPDIAPEGDIPITVRFEPPSRRIDRGNMPHMVKPYLDGIADALRVNDRRFLPTYEFGEPIKDGRVLICVSEACDGSELRA